MPDITLSLLDFISNENWPKAKSHGALDKFILIQNRIIHLSRSINTIIDYKRFNECEKLFLFKWIIQFIHSIKIKYNILLKLRYPYTTRCDKSLKRSQIFRFPPFFFRSAFELSSIIRVIFDDDITGYNNLLSFVVNTKKTFKKRYGDMAIYIHWIDRYV